MYLWSSIARQGAKSRWTITVAFAASVKNLSESQVHFFLD